MSRIFISYSRQDQDFAQRLARDLEAWGVDVWIDQDDIVAGSKWSTAIQRGLDSSDLMLIIVSPDSMASENVEDEWQYFKDQGKPLIPIMWRLYPVHFQLHRLQYIPFHDQDYTAACEQLRTELGRNGIQVGKPSPNTPFDEGKETSSEQKLFYDLKSPQTKGTGIFMAPLGASDFIKNIAVNFFNGTGQNRWREDINLLEGSDDPDAIKMLKIVAEQHHADSIKYSAAFAHARKNEYRDICWSVIEKAALQKIDGDTSRRAWEILGNTGGEKAVSVLLDALAQMPTEGTQRYIIEQLGCTAQYGYEALQPLIDHWHQVSSVQVRCDIIVALRHFRNNDEAVEFLLGILPDLEDEQLTQSVRSLLLIGTEIAINRIKQLFLVSDHDFQSGMLQGLAQGKALGREGGVVALQILEDVRKDRRASSHYAQIDYVIERQKEYLDT